MSRPHVKAPLFRQNHCLRRGYSADRHGSPIICIPPGSNIHAFGTPAQSRRPLIRNVDWTVQEGEAWAVISRTGGGGKGTVFKTLLGHTRIAPPTLEIQGRWTKGGGLYPFLAASALDPYTRVSHVSFRQRSGGEPGAFFDYTARYGAMREAEDRVTVRETLMEVDLPPDRRALFARLTKELNLIPLLDLPMLTLSNGQTRRARVVKAILSQPELLLLDEPLTGLDPRSRASLNEILHQLHQDSSPRIIIGLRKGEEVPQWITHVLEIQDGSTKQTRLDGSNATYHLINPERPISRSIQRKPSEEIGRELVAQLKEVNVSYGERNVLKNITWGIRQGERWHLQGANGSGKTTLLALLTGDHPQSFVQDHLHLPSFGPALSARQRRDIPTAHLRRLIGVVSPEMFDAFPRRHPGMSVWEAVSTGFDGGFVPRTRGANVEARRNGGVGWVDVNDEEVDLDLLSKFASSNTDAIVADKEKKREEIRQWRVARCWEVLECLGPAAWTRTVSVKIGAASSWPSEETETFASLPFSSLSPGEQRLVLVMRALVGRPPLLLLDEAWSGMDDAMIAAARRYLRGEIFQLDSNGQAQPISAVDDKQAVVVITHWEDEVPWGADEVKRFKLEQKSGVYTLFLG